MFGRKRYGLDIGQALANHRRKRRMLRLLLVLKVGFVFSILICVTTSIIGTLRG